MSIELTEPKPGRIDALTGVRGVAACWVVLFHAFDSFGRFAALPAFQSVPVIERGYLAVDLFFLLSGYILAANYESRFRKDQWATVRSFAIGRVFRILPLNTVALFAFAGVVAAFGARSFTAEPLDALSFFASLVLVQAWGPFSATAWNYPAWSLSAEWLAYIGFPVGLVMMSKLRGPLSALVGACLVLALLAAIMVSVGGGDLEHVWKLGVVRCLLEFPAGMLLWIWYSSRTVKFAYPMALACAAFGLLAISLIGPYWELLAPFAFALLIVACADGSTLTRALFANRVVVFLGDISFSIYLLHVIVIGTYHVAGEAAGISAASPFVQWGFLAAMLSTVIVIAHLAWRFVEVPSQAFGRRLGATRAAVREPAR
jgi:peptidoglycan/LPS O-acetylase OafA/YrhL